MLRRVVFLAFLVLPGLCGSLWAEDCGIRGYDGTDILKFDCQDAATFAISPSPLRVGVPLPDGSVTLRGINLVASEISPGVPNPAASKFRVHYTDTSKSPAEEKIMAIGYILPGISACEELQMIGYHPAYPLSKTYNLGSDVPCEATNPTDPNHATSLWGMGYYEYYNHKGFDGVAGVNPATGSNDDNITALGSTTLGTKGFNPINFTGTFDGQGHVIRGLTISRQLAGLFYVQYSATIKNIGLVGGTVSGSYAGCLASIANNTTISNSYATCSVNENGGWYNTSGFGGLVGYVWRTTIKNSYATGNVTGNNNGSSGGLIGRFESSTVNNSYATGNVSGYHAGGLVGYMWPQSIIINSYATGNVTSTEAKGGLVGGLDGESSIINSYATGATGTVPGLAGYCNASVVNNSYATGISLFEREPWMSTITNSSTVESADVFRSTSHAVYVNSAAMGQPSNAWDFNTVWEAVSGDYPHLRDVGGTQ